MIVGTAGHIDHGKTTLVRALTGVDTDRLPEERKRGISIELGYAFLDAPGGVRIGFIDVPGHERLVHTMLAGATGIDFALLLVAADDGPMPQTREHLAVLSLLGIGRGAVVVTKADRVDAARLAAVVAEVDALAARSTLAGSPVLAVSAVSGQGIAELRALLCDAAAARHGRSDAATTAAEGPRAFRLAIDRTFTLDGVGTVVTGTVHAGRVQVGDELRLVPAEPGQDAGRGLRVRSLRAQNREVPVGTAGERCAVALAGIGKDEIRRGQWLVAPAAVPVGKEAVRGGTARLDVRLMLWHDEPRPLRSGTIVHVHAGSDDRLGSVAVLEPGLDSIAPGASALAQLVVHEPIGAWAGDRIVLRDASATRTMAGGIVLDPMAPTRYRRTPERLAELAALERPGFAERLAALLDAAPLGLDLHRFAAAQGRARRPEATALPAGTRLANAAGATGAIGATGATGSNWALAAGHAEAAGATLLAALAAYHAKNPDDPGPDAARLRRLGLPRLAAPLFQALLAALVRDGRVVVRGAFVHLPEHGVRLSAADERIAEKVAPRLAAAGFEGAWARDLARDGGESEPLMRTTLARLAQRGELHQVVKDLYYPRATMATMAVLARRVAESHDGVVTAASFRDATQLGRKRAIQVLEHFDRIGLTRRVGDVHRLRPDSTLFPDERGGAGSGSAPAASAMQASPAAQAARVAPASQAPRTPAGGR